jgi:predicted Rossmann-fold nucleotide-binding protein
LLNLNGYYDSLLVFLNAAVKQGFMSAWQMDLIRTNTNAPALLETLVTEAVAGLASEKLRLDQI